MAASRIGECSAGTSLAWDAAFFTSPVQQVRNSNTCTSGNRTRNPLNRILRRVVITDYSLSSFEIDLFDDIHAKVNQSIQFVEFQLPTSKYLLLWTIVSGNLTESNKFHTDYGYVLDMGYGHGMGTFKKIEELELQYK
ncbi:hypothetical protein V6N13_101102 [Hibiscus sabdariffa]